MSGATKVNCTSYEKIYNLKLLVELDTLHTPAMPEETRQDDTYGCGVVFWEGKGIAKLLMI